MKVTLKNLSLHNVKRFLIAYKRKFQMWFFKSKIFKDNDSLKEFLDAPRHIKEQFLFRLEEMKKSEQGRACLAKGECVCGCSVPDLQLADDACEHNCYPAMMGASEWAQYKIKHGIEVDLVRNVVYYYKR